MPGILLLLSIANLYPTPKQTLEDLAIKQDAGIRQ